LKLKNLPDPIRRVALKRQKEHKSREDIEENLVTAFNWKQTPEGEEYWKNLSKP